MKARSKPRLRKPPHGMRMVLKFRQKPRTPKFRAKDGPSRHNYKKPSRIRQPVVEHKPLRRVTRTAHREGNETILLVEPDVAMREVIRQVLQEAGYLVLQPTNGEEAQQTAARHQGMIHLMTDTDLPQISGRQLAMELTARYPQMKVLYVAGGTARDMIRYGFQVLAPNWLQRPFPMTVMLRKVREIIDQRVGFCS